MLPSDGPQTFLLNLATVGCKKVSIKFMNLRDIAAQTNQLEGTDRNYYDHQAKVFYLAPSLACAGCLLYLKVDFSHCGPHAWLYFGKQQYSYTFMMPK